MEQSNQQIALLVMDVQNAIAGSVKESSPDLLPFLAETISVAREKNIIVIYVVVGFRPGYPEVSAQNKSFSGLKSSGRNLDTKEAMAVVPPIAPAAGDVLVTKRRVSAFSGSDLEVILRAHQVNHIVLTGIATSGVVLSTLREAADKDFAITVLHDCCADGDTEVHQLLTTKVFPRQADVVSHLQWIDSIRRVI